MTLSVTIYFPAHCGHTGSPDWGGCPTGPPVGGVTSTSTPALWPCGPVPFAVTGAQVVYCVMPTDSLNQ